MSYHACGRRKNVCLPGITWGIGKQPKFLGEFRVWVIPDNKRLFTLIISGEYEMFPGKFSLSCKKTTYTALVVVVLHVWKLIEKKKTGF